jgi:TfoX/Sxy family transcriptional regulator of competence genes
MSPREMPPFPKSPPELIERFDTAAARHPGATRRKMFGYPALFTGGNMATGLFGDRWTVRLAADDLERLLAIPGASTFSPMPGRAIPGWAALPAAVVSDDGELDRWIERALAYAASLPPKT